MFCGIILCSVESHGRVPSVCVCIYSLCIRSPELLVTKESPNLIPQSLPIEALASASRSSIPTRFFTLTTLARAHSRRQLPTRFFTLTTLAREVV
jgi:hypothetical protein